MMHKYIPLILAVVTTNAISQLLLTQGMNSIGHFDFAGTSLFKMAPIVALNPYVVGGLAAGFYLFGEAVKLTRILGVGLICVGTLFCRPKLTHR